MPEAPYDLATWANGHYNKPWEGVYLICMSEPMSHARHYIGFAEDIHNRFKQHLEGNGSPMLREAVRRGIKLRVGRIWVGMGRQFERNLKNYKQSHRWCVHCKEAKRLATNKAARDRRVKKRRRLASELQSILFLKKQYAMARGDDAAQPG